MPLAEGTLGWGLVVRARERVKIRGAATWTVVEGGLEIRGVVIDDVWVDSKVDFCASDRRVGMLCVCNRPSLCCSCHARSPTEVSEQRRGV
jgi:hypothetical protein